MTKYLFPAVFAAVGSVGGAVSATAGAAVGSAGGAVSAEAGAAVGSAGGAVSATAGAAVHVVSAVIGNPVTTQNKIPCPRAPISRVRGGASHC